MTAARRTRVFLYALLIAAAVLFFCTKSSPGYPLNDWSDANIYLSVGKGMARGQVVYRDLYDHKGPLLYALHALCALVSFEGFFGVYLMEVLLGAAFLYCAHGVLTLYGARRAAWALLPVLGLLVYSSLSFSEGDSAEELCLPLMAWSLWNMLRFAKDGGARMSARRLLWHGFLAGCVFWIKFTVVGVHAGLFVALVWLCARRSGAREAWRALGLLAAGAAISTVPWVCYFGLNGALGDWLQPYQHDNLLLYSPNERAGLVARLKDMARCGWDWLRANLRYTPLIALGLGYALRKRRAPGEALCVWLAAALGALGVFVGGKSYPYYGLTLAALLPMGFVPPALLLEKPLARLNQAPLCAVCAGAVALCVGLCPLLSYNMTADYGAPFGSPKESTMQYRFAALIAQTPDATLLNYGFMDAGFYTAAGVVPNVKYFHQTNVPLQEMLDEQLRYIEQGVCDYVVARSGKVPACLKEHYELVATEPSPGFWYDEVFLYRKKGLR